MKSMDSSKQKPGYRAAPTVSRALGESSSEPVSVELDRTAPDSIGLGHHENLTKFPAPAELTEGSAVEPRRPDHVVFDSLTLSMVCRHCGHSQPVPMPIKASVLVGMSRRYLEVHRTCIALAPAAAPELLTALELCREQLEACGHDDRCDYCREAREVADDAIAQARGAA